MSPSLITCGSLMKLLNADYNVRLHSHDVQYGSGSGQQSVTAIDDVSEAGSYWKIMGPNGAAPCSRGKPIKCGSTVRLTHVVTKKNLHSHHFQSPLSKNYEVSAFGVDGVGDEGDDWKLHCDSSFWKRGEPFKLQHISTAGYLHISGRTFGQPISGQYEVAASKSSAYGSRWKSAEGVYVQPPEPESGNQSIERDEL
ncbi:unnamed protein product [Schistocephalus solidus]|uniref:MIR domain-containing protein n=1 Tax=Schistocephalus solidus TaxID=70667 RepID=A0A3P7CSH5_SCHSO|nr:unnamed protein product [Schistocephalus solidus]